MRNEIRGSDVFVKADISAGFLALQRVAVAYPAGEYRAGFLAALDACRALLAIDGGGDVEDLPLALPAESVRVLPAAVDASPAPRRLQPSVVVPVDVPESARVVTVERDTDPVVVNPKYWRLAGYGESGFIYDEIAGCGRYVLPADRWVPVPIKWRDQMGTGPVPDEWALFVTIDWALRKLGAQALQALPDGRRQIRG